MWEFPKIRGPNTDPKHEGSYKDTQEMDPQIIETTMFIFDYTILYQQDLWGPYSCQERAAPLLRLLDTGPVISTVESSLRASHIPAMATIGYHVPAIYVKMM